MKTCQTGVSLIETLVTLGIVGLLASLAVATLPTGDDDRHRIDALVEALHRASRISIVTGVPVALAVGPDGQRFEHYVNGSWQILADLPSDMEDNLELDQERGPDGVKRLIFTPGGNTNGGHISYLGTRIETDTNARITFTGPTR